MRKLSLFSAVLILFLLVPASITWAQTISSQKGLITAVFNLSQGSVKVFLPDDIRPGNVISGFIIAEPAGRNARQIENNLAELKKYSISINNEKFPVDNLDKPFQFLAHTDRAITGPMELLNVSGVKAGELTFPVMPANYQQPVQTKCMIPSHALIGTPLRITGPFDGNSSNTNCTIDNKPVKILAESSGQCIVSYPADAGGIHTLDVQEKNKPQCSQQVSGVVMSVSAGELDLHKGQNTYIDVNITGLQNLPDTALLTLNNMTTGIVTMQPSNNVVIPLLPDSMGSGTFNRRFNIQSIQTGGFTVRVNLDLPENLYDDHPPTQPQPGDNPQPKDTTQQPPHDSTTVAQCPGCTCSCSDAKIVDALILTAGDETTYRAEIKASCSGTHSADNLPPCHGCAGIVDPFTYDWHLTSASADKPVVFVGDHDGPGVTIKNKNKGGYTLSVTITVTCPDGHQCTCKAEIIVPPPTVPKGKCPGCQCECDVVIKPLDKQGDLWPYIAVVNTVCTGEFGKEPPCTKCKWVSTTYLWTLTKGDGTVVQIVGARNGPVIVVRTIKKGKFSLHVLITSICSDEHECKCEASYDDEVPDDGCILSWKEMAEPKMTGGLDTLSLSFLKSKMIRRDDFISLKAFGEDTDYIKFFCTSIDCQDITSSVKYQKLPGRVRFEWKIDGVGATGSFVTIGSLPENEKKDVGENVIFKPPYVPLPTGKDADGKEILETKVWTDIILSVIDDDPGQPTSDKTIERDITITTRRTKANPDFYEVSIRQVDKMPAEEKFKIEEAIGACEVNLGPGSWTDLTPIGVPVIKLPILPNNNKLISGEWIRLEANEQIDKDHLHVNCNTTHNCNRPRVFDKNYSDSLEWIWTVDTGKFAGSNSKTDTGRFVIYEAPLGITEETNITITVTVDDKGSEFNDDPQSGTITITAYPGGIKLDYPPVGWLPGPDKPATLRSWLVYKDKVAGWQPAFEHVRRIQFFELMDVSNEKGVCLNAPISKDAKICRDLLLKDEKGLELIDLTKLMKDETIKNKCDPAVYLLEARTAKPENKYEIKVHSEDYGSYGFLRTFANLNMHDETLQKDEIPYYESVPVKKEDVTHPEAGKSKEDRNKKTVYKDNRVNIPMDIDENHIADNGWLSSDGKSSIADPIKNNVDEDATPAGASLGDGLSNYEEYRGFMMQTGAKTTGIKTDHVRTDPLTKTIFIRNENDLPIDLYKTITMLEVIELKEARYYQGDDKRVVNFNAPPVGPASTHLVDQLGLYLHCRTIDGILLGKAFSLTDQPARPNEMKEIVVDTVQVRKHVNKINSKVNFYNTDPLLKAKWGGKFIKLNFEDKLKAVVAHELCHGNNICHHGEGNEKIENSHDLVNGLRSGDIACVMRYDNTGKSIFLNFFPEKPGTTLCTSPVGTFYNAPPVKKDAEGNQIGWGNCLPGRGNCKAQLCISGVGPPLPPCPR